MKKKVKINDGSIPVEDILCTTYQMRNFYLQFRDGFFSDLDVMNYIQHFAAVGMMKTNDIILDVCCGRGLLLPLLRYYKKDITKYIGVDIEEKNITAKTKNICNGSEIIAEKYYPFKTEWIISNVAEMSKKISEPIDFIVYTSAIEHMHKRHGEDSIRECSRVIKDNGTLFLSCPNTPENQSGYDVRYKAHVYEWKLSELSEVLYANGFSIQKAIGLVGDLKTFKTKIYPGLSKDKKEVYDSMLNYVPREFLKPYLFFDFPEFSSEVLLICKKSPGGLGKIKGQRKNVENKKGRLFV